MATLRFVRDLLRWHRRGLLGLILLRTLFRLLPLQVPLLTGALIDGVSHRPARLWGMALPADAHDAVTLAGAAMALTAAATGLAAFLSEALSGQVSRALTGDLRERLLEAWCQAPAAFHRLRGDTAGFRRMHNEARVIGRFAAESLGEGVASGARFVYPAAMLLMLDARLAMLPLAVLPVQALLTRLLEKRQSRLQDALSERKAALSYRLQESLDGLETIQSLGAQREMLRRLKGESAQLQGPQAELGRYSGLLTGSVWGLTALGLGLSWWIGGLRIAAGEMSVGHLVTFTGFASLLALPLRRFAGLFKDTRSALKSLGEIRAFLEAAGVDQVPRRTALQVEGGGIVLDAVVCGRNGQPILDGVSAVFPAGELIWLRGPGGSGKSTLLRLLAGLEAADRGAIRMDGQDLAHCRAESIRDAIVLVPQQPTVFSGTLAANLRLGHAMATGAEMEAVCAEVGLTALLDRLPQRLETVVGEGGMRLAAGDAQRLSLARALLRRPRVLLLDEPASRLDPGAELRLLERLRSLCPRVTVILVAHQVRSLACIGHVFELEDGRMTDWSLASATALQERK
jgi:ATP-binding cassette, subfamily B, bacterial